MSFRDLAVTSFPTFSHHRVWLVTQVAQDFLEMMEPVDHRGHMVQEENMEILEKM